MGFDGVTKGVGKGIGMRDEIIKKLMNTNSLDEFFVMFFGLSFKDKQTAVGDEFVIPEGTILYRARKDNGVDLINESDWWMPPEKYVSRGRFNRDRKPILYLSTMDFVLPREIGLNVDDSYYLSKYRVKNSFSVGSLLKTDDIVNYILHKVAIAIEDDSKLTSEERKHILPIMDKLKPWDILNDFTSSFYLYHHLKSNLYDITNKIVNLVLSENSCGIRYCSCYVPVEMSGGPQILTLDGEINGNYALTNEGIKHLEWLGSEKRIYTEDDYKKNDMSLFISTINCDLSE